MGEAVVEVPIALGMLVALIACFALQNIWKATFGPFLHWLGGLGIKAGHGLFKIDIHPFRAAATFDTNVQNYLTHQVAHAEKRFVEALIAVTEPFLLIAGVALALGLAVDEGFRSLWSHVTTVTPRVINQTIVRPVERAATKAAGISRATYNTLAHRVTTLQAEVRHIAATLPHDIALAPAKVGITAKQLRRLSRRLSRVEELTVGLGAAALVATALGRIGLGWIRCPALGRIGKKIGCGGFSWLEGFFATTFEALVVLDLCRFALAAQQLARVIVPSLAGTLLVQNAVCLGGGASYPSAHDSPKVRTKLTLPSASD